ncbi:unnamed protein product [Trifolium pratense]|nr:unnamed protein product [Trifolium pratense]
MSSAPQNSRSQGRSVQRRSNNTAEEHVHSFESVGAVLRRQAKRECLCEELVLHTVTDITSLNFGKKFWGCRNYRNCNDKGCSFFKWFDDDIVDERDLKIERQKKKKLKLKNDLASTRKWLKMSMVFAFVCFGLNLGLVTLLLSSG